jgi:hypothetical protein
MPRFARQLLIASLVALHATVMLCGPCLHAVSGSDHGPGFSTGADANHVRVHVRAAHVQTDDCPICHFLAQAQLPVDLVSLPSVLYVRVLKPDLPYESVTPSLLLPTSPRAPPAVFAGLS